MKKGLFAYLVLVPLLLGCTPEGTNDPIYVIDESVSNESGSAYYEIFVRSFYDSNDDGLGDLQGVATKMPYLKNLGVKGVWLMPIHPSDSYHKYDVKDYTGIDQEYGDINDFDVMIEAGNQNNIDVILDLILNHTSANHPWFIEAQTQKRDNACSATNSKCRYYNWSDSAQDGYRWSSIANSYYEGRFDSSMPDLNLDNHYVIDELKTAIEYWLEHGVKGFRLDAVTSFYTGNMTKNIQFLTSFNNYVKSLKEDAFIIGEAWENINSVLYQYAGSGMHFFNFPLSELNNKSIASSVINMNGYDFANALVNSEVQIKQASSTSKNALMISNHDMDRSAGYLIGNKAKAAASAYLLTPGHPFIYYGEEIGLKGSRGGANTDANRRLPMVWDGDDINGQCDNPPGTTYDMNLQVKNGVGENAEIPDSLLNHYRKVLNIRNKYPMIHDGLFNRHSVGNAKIAMLSVTKNDEVLYIAHNFSDVSVSFDLPESNLTVIDDISVAGIKPVLNGQNLTIDAYSSVILS